MQPWCIPEAQHSACTAACSATQCQQPAFAAPAGLMHPSLCLLQTFEEGPGCGPHEWPYLRGAYVPAWRLFVHAHRRANDEHIRLFDCRDGEVVGLDQAETKLVAAVPTVEAGENFVLGLALDYSNDVSRVVPEQRRRCVPCARVDELSGHMVSAPQQAGACCIACCRQPPAERRWHVHACACRPAVCCCACRIRFRTRRMQRALTCRRPASC